MLIDATCGEIRPEVCYHIDRAAQVSGLGKHALRTARRNGLRVRYVGGRCFVTGAELIRYIEESGKASKDA